LPEAIGTISCRDWKQLVAGGTQNPAISSLNLLRRIVFLEPPIAESANWKLSFAESTVKYKASNSERKNWA
jgi:hypothetical protein